MSDEENPWRAADASPMPRDGTWFEARNATQTRLVHYSDRRDRFPIGDDHDMWDSAPTHWRPVEIHGIEVSDDTRDYVRLTVECEAVGRPFSILFEGYLNEQERTDVRFELAETAQRIHEGRTSNQVSRDERTKLLELLDRHSTENTK